MEQPLGEKLPKFEGCRAPDRRTFYGRWCELQPVSVAIHLQSLFEAFTKDDGDCDWTYLPYGPYHSVESFRAWMLNAETSTDPSFFSVVVGGQALGILSLMRIEPQNGCVEVGHIHFGSGLKRTQAATEAVVLLAHHVFELGYRRLEWKCDALNAASRHAAERLGFQFEGVFRQHLVYKGRNRDTAWYSMLDSEWSERRAEFDAWLHASNFDTTGKQVRRLSPFRKAPGSSAPEGIA